MGDLKFKVVIHFAAEYGQIEYDVAEKKPGWFSMMLRKDRP